jgi:hypothetical protein
MGKVFRQDFSTVKKDMQESGHRTLAVCRWNLTEDVSIARYERMNYRKKL